jgi:hypothetical protein
VIKWEPFQYQNAVHATKLLTDSKKVILRRRVKYENHILKAISLEIPLEVQTFFAKLPFLYLNMIYSEIHLL